MTDDPDHLVQFVFRSKPVEPLSDAELKKVIGDWDTLHRQLDLSGFLIRFETTFVGVIEGARGTVIARLETMSSDSILAGLTVLREAEIERRRFGTWRFQDLSTLDGDEMLRATGGLFAHRLTQELYRGS